MARLSLAVAVAVLVFAPSALAKGPFQICGPSGCATLGDEASPPIRVFGADPSTPRLPGVAPASYYLVRFADLPGTLAYWVPGANALRLVGARVWVSTLAAEDAVLREKTAGLQPYPAPQRVSVSVRYETVKQPRGYFRLFTIGAPAAAPRSTAWQEVWLHGGGSSPWTDYGVSLWISARGSLLKRDGAVFAIPPALAQRVRARLPLG